MPRSTKFGKNQQGNLLVEAMLGIALAGAGFLTYYEIEHKVSDRSQFSKVTSNMYQQYNVFLTALEKYAQKSNSTQVVSCQTLKNGYLAPDFNCTDYLGDTLEGILIKNQTQTPTAYVVGIPTANSQNMLHSYNVSSIQVLNQALAQSQPENTAHGFFVVNTNNYIGYPVTDISQSVSFSTVASYLPKQGLNLSNNSYVIALVDASTLNPSATPPSCTSSSSVLNPPGTWSKAFTNITLPFGSSSTTIVTQCSYTEWQPYQYCSYVNGTASSSNNAPPFSTSSCTCVHGSVVFNYTGIPQYFIIPPSITACGSITFTLLGGGGGGGGNAVVYINGSSFWASGVDGGAGGITTGVIPVSSLTSDTLTILTGGGGGGAGFIYLYSTGGLNAAGGGGGGSFVCEGTQCNQSTVLLAAGGGGGGGQGDSIYWGQGGFGGGGNAEGTPGYDDGNFYNYGSSCAGVGGGAGTLNSGGNGGFSFCGYNGGSGGFMMGGFGFGSAQAGYQNDGGIGGFGGGGAGGGGAGGGYCGGGGGGGGYYGGGGGGAGKSNGGGSGGGGSGYCAPIVQNCGGVTGGANNGGFAANYFLSVGFPGGNGQVVISW